MTNPKDNERLFSEEEVRDLIGRAAELEYDNANAVSLGELQEIANGLGISESTLNRALAERHAGRSITATKIRHLGHPISLALFGGIGAIAMMTMHSFYAFLGVAALNLFCAVEANRPNAYVRYTKRSVSIWLGFLLPTLFQHLPDVFTIAVLAGISLIGMAVIVVVRGLTADIDGNDGQSPPSLVEKLVGKAHKFKAWIHQLTELSVVRLLAEPAARG